MNLSHAAERMVMSQPLWWVLMGLEMVLHVVHGPTLEKLLQLEWAALHTGLNERSMRPDRPQKDALLHQTFDIDAEANLLDLIEADVDHTGSVRTVLGHLDHGADLMLELIVWASIGRWEVWEGRAFLYLEVALDRTFDSVEDLYLEAVWDELGAAVTRRTPENSQMRSSSTGWVDGRCSVRPLMRHATHGSCPRCRTIRMPRRPSTKPSTAFARIETSSASSAVSTSLPRHGGMVHGTSGRF